MEATRASPSLSKLGIQLHSEPRSYCLLVAYGSLSYSHGKLDIQEYLGSKNWSWRVSCCCFTQSWVDLERVGGARWKWSKEIPSSQRIYKKYIYFSSEVGRAETSYPFTRGQHRVQLSSCSSVGQECLEQAPPCAWVCISLHTGCCVPLEVCPLKRGSLWTS